jgi:hypothetical protein
MIAVLRELRPQSPIALLGAAAVLLAAGCGAGSSSDRRDAQRYVQAARSLVWQVEQARPVVRRQLDESFKDCQGIQGPTTRCGLQIPTTAGL